MCDREKRFNLPSSHKEPSILKMPKMLGDTAEKWLGLTFEGDLTCYIIIQKVKRLRKLGRMQQSFKKYKKLM